ncbi:MAG: hypothetical protein AAFV86_09725 [Pseudomonadota bacterium]
MRPLLAAARLAAARLAAARLAVACLAALALPAAADGRAVLYGTWGTEAQCARDLLRPDWPVRAEPYVIGEHWLQHGQFWCRLSWFPVSERENGIFTGAVALCGEDGVNGYRLLLTLSGEELTLSWAGSITNGPLRLCPAS